MRARNRGYVSFTARTRRGAEFVSSCRSAAELLAFRLPCFSACFPPHTLTRRDARRCLYAQMSDDGAAKPAMHRPRRWRRHTEMLISPQRRAARHAAMCSYTRERRRLKMR